jgi:hypothetical protein
LCDAISSITILASTPPFKYGHAFDETVPQFIPFIMVLPVSIDTIFPAFKEVSRQAAAVGSTVTTAAKGNLLL